LEDLDIDGRIVIKWILKETGWDGAGWIYTTYSRTHL
jgi:hypothetical protein